MPANKCTPTSATDISSKASILQAISDSEAFRAVSVVTLKTVWVDTDGPTIAFEAVNATSVNSVSSDGASSWTGSCIIGLDIMKSTAGHWAVVEKGWTWFGTFCWIFKLFRCEWEWGCGFKWWSLIFEGKVNSETHLLALHLWKLICPLTLLLLWDGIAAIAIYNWHKTQPNSENILKPRNSNGAHHVERM